MKRCQQCGTENDHDGRFCRNCGGQLPEPPPPEPSRPTAAAGETEGRPAPLPQTGRCPSCGAEASPGMNFCRGCGASLGARPTTAPAEGSAFPEAVSCPRCRSMAPAGHMFCPSCGAQLPTLAGTPSPDVARRLTGPRPETSGDIAMAPTASGRAQTPAPLVREGSHAAPVRGRSWGALVSVNRDGSDGAVYHLSEDRIDIGADGHVVIGNDSHVAGRHARIEKISGGTQVTPLESLNGVYLRLREPTEILSGAILLLGREVCRIDVITEAQRDAPGLIQHGLHLFASPTRRPWARLSHLWNTGVVGDIRHMSGDEVVVGREEGDIIFADDEFMSRRHAVFKRQNKRCIVEDLGSSNGTFLRLDGATLVSDGDHLRIGDHMFRFERRG